MSWESLQGLILPIGIMVIFYLFAIRPQKKKDQQIREMRNSIRVGDEIISIGGIYGKVIRAKEDILTLEVGSAKTRLDVTRWAVGSVVTKKDSKNLSKDDLVIEEDNNKE